MDRAIQRGCRGRIHETTVGRLPCCTRVIGTLDLKLSLDTDRFHCPLPWSVFGPIQRVRRGSPVDQEWDKGTGEWESIQIVASPANHSYSVPPKDGPLYCKKGLRIAYTTVDPNRTLLASKIVETTEALFETDLCLGPGVQLSAFLWEVWNTALKVRKSLWVEKTE